jgi:inositol-phosphate phosphatase/L-galactose 1-phosphate phosphatase/histidinol-phosphatase
MTQPDITSIASCAMDLADTARRLARSHFRQVTAYDRKADDSPVTAADRAIEAALRNILCRRFPEHAILGEEEGLSGNSRNLWALDPIDGTKSFMTGFPLFGTLIAFTRDRLPTLGVIEIPATGERWSAYSGQTVFTQNGQEQRVSVSACRSLETARVYTTSPDCFSADDLTRYNALSGQAAVRRYGGDCYIYGILASGFCDLVVESSLQPYDYLALVPVVQNAGGIITDWQGQALGLHSQGQVIAAATPALHRRALDILNA